MRLGWIVPLSLFVSFVSCAPARHASPPAAPEPKGAVRPTLTVTKAPADAVAAPPLAAEEALEAPVVTRFRPEPAAAEAARAPGVKRADRTGAAAGADGASDGLSLSGIGEGGGGRGEGIGLGAIGTHGAGTASGAGFGSGSGRLAGAHRARPPKVRMGATSVGGSGAPSLAVGSVSGAGAAGAAGLAVGSSSLAAPAPRQARFSGVRTGEWDDNANFREYGKWLAGEDVSGVASLDLSVRRFIVVRDAAGKPVPSCSVDLADSRGGPGTVTLTTTSSGRAILFPRAEGLAAEQLVATARCQGLVAARQVRLAAGDGVIDLQLPIARALPEQPTIDVAFVLDTTGSMSEEIDALRGTLEHVASQLSAISVRPRVGLVEYRDRSDAFVTRLHQMTTDVGGLGSRIAAVRAEGGGDTPEHVNEALRVAIRSLRFRRESLARLVFLIGDAPPHLDYQGDEGYAGAVREANHAGIQVFTIAASGMDRTGQVVWRQIAQYTGGTHMFVLRGGAGPQSEGGGEPGSSCGDTHTDYTSKNLDALIVGKVQAAIAAQHGDPMRIAGLHRDEKDVPCNQRIAAAD